MSEKKLTISWEELRDPKVEEKLREREAVTSTQQHYEQAQVPAPAATGSHGRFAWLRASIAYMTLFGLLGGLLGGAVGWLPRLAPDRRAIADELIRGLEQTKRDLSIGKLEESEARLILRQLARDARGNPYYALHLNEAISEQERNRQLAELRREDDRRDRIATLIHLAVAVLLTTALLCAAESIVDFNAAGAMLLGGIGGVLAASLLAGLSVLTTWLLDGLLDPDTLQLALPGAAGLVVGLVTGLVARSPKRAVLCSLSGLSAGVGGAALASLLPDRSLPASLIAPALVGLLVGFTFALVDRTARQGWLRVVEGLIAGKQFILYRNPTYIGSAPLSHVYLFKDPLVGRRHAAVHAIPGGFEIENLPLGGATLVNGRPVHRQRLRHGDRVQIGRTAFLFQEKPQGR
jgi:hypothetical protein